MPKKKSSQAETKAADPARFEEALAELEEIVGEMEGDRLPLDQLLKKYERGTGLLNLCQGHITKARERIEQIAADAKSGGAVLEAFDQGSGETTESAPGAKNATQDEERPTRDDDIQLL